mgnify:CR=1 FL=1
MSKRIIRKTLIILFVILLSILTFNTNFVQASSISDVIGGAQEFINSGIEDDSPAIDEDNLVDMSNMVYNALLVIATIIAVIVGLVIAIQFMTGSVEQKAKVKETLIPYIAGCIVIFGAFGIWKIVVSILSQA